MISRRRFLQAGAATGVILAMPRWAYPFSQSVPGINKFVVQLPGLIADTTTGKRGIPVLTKDPSSNGAADVYKITAEGFAQDLLGAASTLPAHNVRLWGYASDFAGSAPPQYLGGVIVATGGKTAPKPVKLEVTNALPKSEKILPLDITLIDPVSREQTDEFRLDRMAIHLHGGFVFWDSDGGPFHWFSSPGADFVHGSSFINGPTTAPGGTATYFYPNQQSARFLWYHDHAYGVTRTNAYAGLASAYLITDTLADMGEMHLIDTGVIPGKGLDAFTGELGIPLIIQDKTFWDPASDAHYDDADVVPAAMKGDLWYPHVYEGGLDPTGLPDMSLPPNPAQKGNVARWGTPDPALSKSVISSSVPEFFSDTILVNGAPYPVFDVDPKRYRFRFLNASQGRFYNLQLYVADSSKDGITLKRHSNPAEVDPNDNPILVPSNLPGPAFVQIANEGGFLPAPAIFGATDGTNHNSNQVMSYKIAAAVASRHRVADDGRLLPWRGDRVLFVPQPGDPTEGNAALHNLLIAPAERPDVIIDFRQTDGTSWPPGTEFILYNDAPAPFPGGDTRNDYFVVPDPVAAGLPAGWSNDLTSIGGAKQSEGQGPDTRILMKFRFTGAAASSEPAFAAWVATLKTELPKAFDAVQDPPLDITGITHLKKTLGEDNDEFGRLRQYLGNTSASVRTYLDFPSDVARVGETQVWDIYNTTADTHPMHFHLVNVQVIERQQWKFNPDGTPVLPLEPDTSLPKPPVDDNEKGWRETVRMNPGEITTVAMKFTLPEGTAPKNSPRLLASYGINGAEYVWHCHILEHEEHDMMRPLVVVA